MDAIQLNKALAQQFLSAISVLDIEALMPLLAPEFTLDSKGSTALSGPHPLSELPMMIQLLRACLSDTGVRLDLVSMTADENRVACEARGDGVTVTGKPYRNQYVFLLEMKHGKIVKCSEYMDTRLMEEVLGPIIQGIIAAKV
jgi:ketosteroid isomerase-like protein